MYDITRFDTFLHLKDWLKDINESVEGFPLIIIVGNKTDLIRYRRVEKEVGQKFAEENGFLFEEISVKNNDIMNVFNKLCENIIEKIRTNKIEVGIETGIKLGGNNIPINKSSPSKCC